MSTPFSLFGHLTTFEKNYGEYGATDLSKFLIKVVAHNACLAKRNSLTSYKLVERARDICVEIDALITATDSSNDDSDDTWAKYDRYTEAIDPLEGFLFRLADESEKEFDKFLPSDLLVSELLSSIEEWEHNRTQLRTALGLIYTNPTFASILNSGVITETTTEEKHDDLALLSSLCTAIKRHSLTDGEVQVGRTYIADIKAIAKGISSTAKLSTPDESLLQCIRCVMIVYGAMDLSKSTTHKDNGAQLLASTPLWVQAKVLLEKVQEHLSGESNLTTDKLEVEWNNLRVLLLSLKAILPPEYIMLRSAARTVRRPYFSRTLCLVSMCRELATYFSKTENSTAANIPALKSAITKSLEAIREAELDATTIKVYDDIAGTKAGKAFDAAVDEIVKSATAYKIQSTFKGDELVKALTADQNRMNQLKDRFTKYDAKQSAPGAPGIGTITITIRTDDGKQKSYTGMDTDTRLSAVLWRFASEFPNDREKLLSSVHCKEGEIVYGFDQLVPDTKTLTLVMSSSGDAGKLGIPSDKARTTPNSKPKRK